MDPLRLHQLPRRKRRALRGQLRDDLLRTPRFQQLERKTQREFCSSASTALAAKMLLLMPEGNTSILQAKEKMLQKTREGVPADYFLVYPRPRLAPIKEEFLLFCEAARSGRERHFPGARNLLQKITSLEPAPVFEIPPLKWERLAWQKSNLLAMYDTSSELILMKADSDPYRAEHIALHEMIHSLQKHTYSEEMQFPKATLLEGVTEEIAVRLDQEYGFYTDERLRTLRAIEESSFRLEDFTFSSGEQIWSRLLEDIPSGRLQRILAPSH